MLFLFDGVEAKTQGEESANLTTKGQDILTQISQLTTTFRTYVASVLPTDYATIAKNVTTQLTTMEDSAKALQRSMGGTIVNADKFRQKLEQSVFDADDANNSLLDMNLTFKDAVDLVSAMATEQGRMVSGSKDVTRSALEFSKATNMSTSEVGKMVIDFSQFGGTQKESVQTMSDLGKTARKSGLDAKSFTTEVAQNLKQASLFGFKNGVKDIEEMVKKTKLLGTSLEKLGIKGSAEKLLDPEKAMEAAANIQMIGGNIGALGDPFQLLYMGQKDMKKLTDEVLNMSKATFTFDKTTGAFTQTTEDMYALRAQAEALGINYEETANAGKELAKVDFVKSSTKLAQKITDEDTQNLVAGLAQISKDGKVNIDLPGLNKNFDSLDKALEDPEFMTALDEYQKNATKTDKDLALSQMSIAEKQSSYQNVIMHAVVKMLTDSPAKEKAFIDSIEGMTDKTGKMYVETANSLSKPMSEGILTINKAGEKTATLLNDSLKKIDVNKNIDEASQTIATALNLENIEDFFKNGLGGESGTEEVPQIQTSGNANNNTVPQIQTPNNTTVPQIQKPNNTTVPQIQTSNNSSNLEKIFLKAQDATIFLSDTIKQKNDMTSNNTISGKIDFGTLTVKVDAPAGIDKTTLQQTLNSKQFTNHIMDMVANQKSYYTNQATIEG